MSTLRQQAGPFDSAPPDENTEMAALVRSLRLSQGFSLLFAQCNLPDQRQRLIAILREQLPQLRIQEIVFDKPIRHLLDELRKRIEEPAPGAIFVSGFENTLQVAAKADATPLVANLNASRNSFSVYLSCPLVIWVPEYIITAIMRGAPDFFSVRSGIYLFLSASREAFGSIESLLADDELTVANLSRAEKEERIATVQQLLAGYEALPPEPQNTLIQAQLLLRLGHLHLALGRWRDAAVEYRECFAMLERIGNERGKGIVLNNLGRVYQRLGRLKEAEECYQQILALKSKFNDPIGVAQTAHNLAVVFAQEERWSEAAELFNQALAIHTAQGDRANEGITLGSLGNLNSVLQRWKEAEACYLQALPIIRELGNRADEAIFLNNLGNVYSKQGRLSEAQAMYESSLAIKRSLGDRVGEGTTLNNIALLFAERGELSSALKIGRQAIEVLEATENALELEKARMRVSDWEQQVIQAARK